MPFLVSNTTNKNFLFVVLIVLCSAALLGRLFLGMDSDYLYRYSPYDDNLYLYGAEHLYKYGTLGDYLYHPLLKLPGFSVLIVFLKNLGLPYILTLNFLYFISVCYLGYVAYKLTQNYWVLICGVLVALVNPIAISSDWFFVMREPISCIADILILASSLFLAKNGLNRKSFPHLIVLGLVFLATQFLREEDMLRWAYLLVFGLLILWQNKFQRRFVVVIISFLSVLFLLYQLTDFSYRTFVNKTYGLPIKHEISEGELPKLLSNLRSISVGKENRMATIKWDALSKLSLSVPEFKQIYDHLPIPSANSLSCNRLGVCKEWSYGYLVFWILSATTDSGVATNLVQAQKFYHVLNDKIKEKCSRREIICKTENERLIPSFEIKWTRAFFEEARKNLTSVLFPFLTGYDSSVVNAIPTVALSSYESTLGVSKNKWVVENYGLTLSRIRISIVPILRLLIAPLLIFCIFLLLLKPALFPGFCITPIYVVAISYFLYSLLRLIVLAYLAIYMGGYEDRMFFSTYVGLLSLSAYVIYDWFVSKRNYDVY